VGVGVLRYTTVAITSKVALGAQLVQVVRGRAPSAARLIVGPQDVKGAQPLRAAGVLDQDGEAARDHGFNCCRKKTGGNCQTGKTARLQDQCLKHGSGTRLCGVVWVLGLEGFFFLGSMAAPPG
jgi:hypothetical protein